MLWNSLLLLFLVSFIFVIGESYFRFSVDTTDSFGLNKITQRWMERHYKPNNFYARDNIDYNLKIQNGKRRVAFLGDSFTAGHGIKNVDDRFPNLIRSVNPGFEVHVLADNGMESINQLDLVRKLINDNYQFDVVVLVYNLNDISYLLPETNEIYDRVFAFHDKLNYFGNNSYFINTLSFRYFAWQNQDLSNYYDYVRDGYFSGIWNEQASVLEEMKNLIEFEGGQLQVVTFPFLHDKKEDYKFEKVHDKLGNFWLEMSIPNLDLEHVFDDFNKQELVVNKYDAHPNEFANMVVYEAIDEFIKGNLK